jgi:hypothetical protein
MYSINSVKTMLSRNRLAISVNPSFINTGSGGVNKELEFIFTVIVVRIS